MLRSPAQLFTLVIGLTLVGLGVLGFFYTASFSTGDGAERDAVLGIFDVNGWHNVMHIVSGAIGLAVVGLVLGRARLCVRPRGRLPGDSGARGREHLAALHLLIAVAGIGAGLASPSHEPRLTT